MNGFTIICMVKNTPHRKMSQKFLKFITNNFNIESKLLFPPVTVFSEIVCIFHPGVPSVLSVQGHTSRITVVEEDDDETDVRTLVRQENTVNGNTTCCVSFHWFIVWL